MRAGSLLVAAGLLAAACSASSQEPLVEYPPIGDPSLPDGGPIATGTDAGADAAQPIAGRKILDRDVLIEGRTSDGHLVFFADADLSVWPEGASAPVTIQKDFYFGEDERTVRGRFVGVWTGESVLPSPLIVWSQAAGVETIAPEVHREALYPKPSSNVFAYGAAGTSVVRRDIWVTEAGKGAGTLVLAGLNSGALDTQCRPTITFGATHLVIAGCTTTTTPRVATYALDGSGLVDVILDDSRPGVWLDPTRTRALVQTSTESSIRSLSASGTAVALDTPVRQAVFSATGSHVVYRRSDGAVRRAATTSPASPVTLVPSALSILDISPDARFVVAATTGDPGLDSDLVVADATAAGAAPRVIAAEKAASFGLSSDGTHLVYLAPRAIGIEGPLYVVQLPSGTPQKLSDEARRVHFDGKVVYWQEWVEADHANVLKAARISDPGTVITIDTGLDPLTASAVVVRKKLYVASKLGLWEYPALE